ncbi:hypothetical protein C8Q80DRAFT_1265636 [Daedaleopsis nitida]|nr:hypothetical protein C8Q80DRAFT_1265636 [Daedaleopsis nitida]
MTQAQQSVKQLLQLLQDAVESEICSLSVEDLRDRDVVIGGIQSRLRSRINVLAPVSVLPTELLISIFEEVSDYSPDPDFTARPRLHYRNPQIVLSHVCRTWRDIAVNIPELWTVVDNADEDRLEVFAARAKHFPLLLYIDANCDRFMSQVSSDLFRRYTPRVRGLVIITHLSPAPHPPLYLRHPAPQLEFLSISCPMGEARRLQARIVAADKFPILFRHRTSGLRGLEIRNVSSWVPGNHFPSLTHLRLSFSNATEIDAQVFLLTILSNTPCLEVLQVTEVLQPEASLSSRRIVLPSMRSVSFTEVPLPLSLSVLNALDVPRGALIRLDDVYSPGEAALDIPSRLIDGLSRWEVAADGEYLHTVLEDQDSRSGLWIRSTCASTSDWTNWLSHLGGVTYPFPLTSIETLHISITNAAGVLPMLLPQMSHLAELAILVNPSCCEGPEPIALLRGVCTALAQEDSACCPLLRAFAIESNTHDPVDVAYEHILAMAATRARLDRRIERFAIQPRRFIEFDPVITPDSIAQAFRDAFAPLEQHVEVVEIVVDGELNRLCPFKMRECWNVPDAEKYWRLVDYEKPHYDLPW